MLPYRDFISVKSDGKREQAADRNILEYLALYDILFTYLLKFPSLKIPQGLL